MGDCAELLTKLTGLTHTFYLIIILIPSLYTYIMIFVILPSNEVKTSRNVQFSLSPSHEDMNYNLFRHKIMLGVIGCGWAECLV